jgi:hypothetical protein
MDERFVLARYRVRIQAGADGLALPEYKGATIRGALSKVFKDIVCIFDSSNCNKCTGNRACSYYYIFETTPPEDSKALKNFAEIPRPYVIEPPTEAKTYYKPGENLSFDIILIGKAVDYFPYFILAFREMGNKGIGINKRPFDLLNVDAIGLDEEKVVYQSSDNTIALNSLCYKWPSLAPNLTGPVSKCKVVFETPTFLKQDGEMATIPEFHIFFRLVMRRISALSYFHQDFKLDADYRGLVDRSKQVELAKNYTVFKRWTRYSNRQQKKLPVEGIIGFALYKGCLDEFMPWIMLGEQVHVGKNTVAGLGKYSLHFNF